VRHGRNGRRLGESDEMGSCTKISVLIDSHSNKRAQTGSASGGQQ
jgi:hypothetical protein